MGHLMNESLIAATVPQSVRDRIRAAILDPKARELFAEVEAWEDEMLAGFNICASAADRMADALEEIENLPPPLNNRGAALAQCDWIKRRAKEARGV